MAAIFGADLAHTTAYTFKVQGYNDEQTCIDGMKQEFEAAREYDLGIMKEVEEGCVSGDLEECVLDFLAEAKTIGEDPPGTPEEIELPGPDIGVGVPDDGFR